MLFVVALVGLLCSLAIPGLMRAKGAAQAASALGSLRIVNSAELSFAITCGLGFYSPDLLTLGVPPPGASEGYLPPEMSSDFTFVKSGYTFGLSGTSLAGAPATCNGLGAGQSAPGYAMVGDPLDVTTGIPRFFGSNSDGVIYEHTTTLGGGHARGWCSAGRRADQVVGSSASEYGLFSNTGLWRLTECSCSASPCWNITRLRLSARPFWYR